VKFPLYVIIALRFCKLAGLLNFLPCTRDTVHCFAFSVDGRYRAYFAAFSIFYTYRFFTNTGHLPLTPTLCSYIAQRSALPFLIYSFLVYKRYIDLRHLQVVMCRIMFKSNSANTYDFRLGFDIEVLFLFIKNTGIFLFFFWSLVNRIALLLLFLVILL
jgi:hypothetical protein